MRVPFRSCLEINGATERSGEIWHSACQVYKMVGMNLNSRYKSIYRYIKIYIYIYIKIYIYIYMYKDILYISRTDCMSLQCTAASSAAANSPRVLSRAASPCRLPAELALKP